MSNYSKHGQEAALLSDDRSVTTTFAKPEVCSQEYRRQIRKDLHDALSQEAESIEWTTVHSLLMKLLQHQAATNTVVPHTQEHYYAFSEDDPLGRIFLTRLVSKDPPVETLDQALRAFPNGICSSHPVAFFSACSNASLEVVDRMVQHTTAMQKPGECPYPWILSQFISLEAAQAMMQAYPQGVLEKPAAVSSAFLTSESCVYSPLDYVMFSPTMIQKSAFDEMLWQKFKLMLVTVESVVTGVGNGVGCQISPVHTILEKILEFPDFFGDSARVQHVFWLLHELHKSDEWVFQKQRPDQNGEGLYPLHLLLSMTCPAISHAALVAARELCKIVAEADTLAVMHGVTVSGGELFPLHMAIENGWPCHDLLLSIWPECIEMTDPRTGLLPFQSALATSSARPETDICLDVAFELLRANPTISSTCGSANAAMMMHTSAMDIGNPTVEGKA